VETDEVFRTGVDRKVDSRRTFFFFAWYAGAALSIWLLGIVIALPLFVLLYSLIEGREPWWVALLLCGGTVALIWGLFEVLFKVIWPSGLLFL
jgi:hypothetical protein